MAIEELRDVVAQLGASATALAALSAELRARASGQPLHPSLRATVDDVLRECGALKALEGTSAADLAPFIAEIRHFWTIDNDFIENPGRAGGWTYTDEAVLESGGAATAGFAHVLPRIAPSLDGLAARLAAPDATFLDVGTGVAGLAIAMAKKNPSLHVVGLDTWAPSLARARQNVADAGLTERVTLREQPAETLDETNAFDLAWVPAPFLPPAVLARVVERVQRALKPGGWLLLATGKMSDDLRGAAMRLRIAQFGGRATTEEEARALLGDSGFVDVRALPSPPRDFKIIVAARRRP